jgi:hypothetical protein
MAQWTHDGTLPDDIDTVRTALFFEQRRYRHYGRTPRPREIPYLLALYDICRHDPRVVVDTPDDSSEEPPLR